MTETTKFHLKNQKLYADMFLFSFFSRMNFWASHQPVRKLNVVHWAHGRNARTLTQLNTSSHLRGTKKYAEPRDRLRSPPGNSAVRGIFFGGRLRVHQAPLPGRQNLPNYYQSGLTSHVPCWIARKKIALQTVVHGQERLTYFMEWCDS